ncbi:hypothetical protein BHM03_00021062 [Ensete ventricosum]|nr:hypothetical protein BHM03_00021062 [Ensete ventricosum]
MCRAFPTTLRGVARGWYGRLSLASIRSFDQLAREFEANFLISTRPNPTVASLLEMRQKEDEALGPYLARSTREIRATQSHASRLSIQKAPWRGNRCHSWRPGCGWHNSLIRKTYARVEVQKRPRARRDLEITFESKGEYSDHDDALVMTARIVNARVKRIMIDTGSSADILYFDAFLKLGMTNRDLVPITSTLTGFTGDVITPTGITTLPMTFDDEPRTKTLIVHFMVVELHSAYHVIIGRSTLNKLRAVVSTYHRSMKFSTSAGLGEQKGQLAQWLSSSDGQLSVQHPATCASWPALAGGQPTTGNGPQRWQPDCTVANRRVASRRLANPRPAWPPSYAAACMAASAGGSPRGRRRLQQPAQRGGLLPLREVAPRAASERGSGRLWVTCGTRGSTAHVAIAFATQRRRRNPMAATTRVAAAVRKGEGKKSLGHSFWQNDDFTPENFRNSNYIL